MSTVASSTGSLLRGRARARRRATSSKGSRRRSRTSSKLGMPSLVSRRALRGMGAFLRRSRLHPANVPAGRRYGNDRDLDGPGGADPGGASSRRWRRSTRRWSASRRPTASSTRSARCGPTTPGRRPGPSASAWRGEAVGALAGVPIGVKDLENATGFRTTFGDPAHASDPPATRDSVEVARLRAAGAVVVGKTNTPAYGFHAETNNLVFGPTRNPWALGRTCGGSSGGSAVAVASGMVTLATGSDGGGSIRIPSETCGICGFKPTHGVVPGGDDDAADVGPPLDPRADGAHLPRDRARARRREGHLDARSALVRPLAGSFVAAAQRPRSTACASRGRRRSATRVPTLR